MSMDIDGANSVKIIEQRAFRAEHKHREAEDVCISPPSSPPRPPDRP